MTNRATVTVTYEDETTETFNPNKPKFLLAMERKFGVQVPEKHEHITWLAWHALGRPDGDMDKWLERVEEIAEVSEPTSDAEDEDSGEPDPS